MIDFRKLWQTRAPRPERAARPAGEDRPAPAPEEIVAAYHQTTKHHAHRYARGPGYLDWDTQPDPFRRFPGADAVLLPFIEHDWTPPYARLFEPAAVSPRPFDLAGVAALFELSLGLTAWKEFQASRWSLRCNPSSGNLHPTEGYVVLGPPDGGSGADVLGAGAACVGHYAPAEHAIEVRARLDPAAWNQCMRTFPSGSFLVGLTSIHWREAWKYGERAYRYCHHDTGHAWASLRLAAAMLGWRLVLLEDLSDGDVARLLGVDRLDEFHEAEREEPEGLAVVVPAVADGETIALDLPREAIDGVSATAVWSGRANVLSPDHVEWSVIDVTAGAAVKPRTAARTRPLANPGLVAQNAATAPVDDGPTSRQIAMQRRSAVDLDGKTRISRDAFHRILSRVMPSANGTGWIAPPWDTIAWEARVHLALFVHRVDELPPGLYVLPRKPAATEALRAAMRPAFRWERAPGGSDDVPLMLLDEADGRATATSVSCGQNIAGDGVFSLGMIAEFSDTLREQGAWTYRRLHWEAGMIGQVLYLEAEAAGIRGTGIGCFFDDAVHDVLGLRDTKFQTLYHFTMGGPVDDPRLSTLPPYSAERRGRPTGLVGP